MLLDKPLDLAQFAAVEAVVGGQRDRIEPELGLVPACLDVDMRRLLPLIAVEEEPEASDPKDSRHRHSPSFDRDSSRGGLLREA